MNTHDILKELKDTYPHQKTFLQTAEEILGSVESYLTSINATEEDYRLVRRILTPERIVSFKVDWVNDKGVMETNIGYRVQYNSVLGPYKGGLRFDPSVNEDVLNFLGLEQIFKNALTGLRLGGGKGGSNFNPKGRSDNEIRAFCQAFMLELYRHIGLETDVPAGDMGVGGREIGYLYGMYKKITNRNEGALTGKDELFGGSCGRTSATGHGVVYFAEAMAKANKLDLASMAAVISGSGNVAEYTARKLMEIGTKVVTLSDRGGYLYKETGFTIEDIKTIAESKKNNKNLADVKIADAVYESGKPWGVKADIYIPCATQNEIDKEDAEKLVKYAALVVEGANMPVSAEAVEMIKAAGIPLAPGKAANAGGVSVSGIEMAQNAAHYAWTCAEVESELRRIMNHIHDQCVAHGQTEKGIDYIKGANIAGFKKVFEGAKKLGW